jgi:hypothetical protein
MWGSGRIVTREYSLSGFSAIEAARFDVEIIQSDEFGVTVQADDNVIDRLTVRTSGETLILRTRRLHWMFGRFTLEATIRMPALTAVSLSEAATASVVDFRRIGRLDVEVSGASELRGTIAAETLDLLASGASRTALAGSAGRVTIEGSGASHLDLKKLAAQTAAVGLSGASRATVNVADTIESIEASGASRLRYAGDPRVGHIESSGASSIARV